MEKTGLDLFHGGGGGVSVSSGASGSVSTLSKAEVVEQDYVGLSSEGSSYAGAEAELDLGLGLSLGVGVVKTSNKSSAWGEYGRILTAKDFPSIVSAGSSASSSSSSGKANNGSSSTSVVGTKRAAESIAQEVGSAHGVSQFVGWPPIRAYRINSLVNQTKAQAVEGDKTVVESGKVKDVANKKTENGINTPNAQEKGQPRKSQFVKVNMDGVPIGRKVDLSVHTGYETLSKTLEVMFISTNTATNSIRSSEDKEHGVEVEKLSKLLDGSSEFVLTYEDKDGDWMLVGDVPWGMFIDTVKRLRIMRKSEANGLAPRFQQSGTRLRHKTT